MIVPATPNSVPLLRLYVDGASRGNPGPAGGGVVIASAEGEVLAGRGFFFGRATNNVAEYRALLSGLALAGQFAPQRLEIYADSELMVRQITGQYRVKSPDLAPLFEQVQLALLKFDNWQIRHVPRSANQRADRLANLAINRKGEVDDSQEELPEPMRRPDERPAGESGGAAVQIAVLSGCDSSVCPAGMRVGEVFRCDDTAPAGLCLYAAAVLLPAAAMLLDQVGQPEAGVPRPVQLACPRQGCRARFELTVLANG